MISSAIEIPLGINTVVQGSDGVFYGTTQYGGDLQDSSGGLGDGMIFSIDTNGNFNTLYTFDENNFDGFNPTGPLVAGGNGVFYGITSSGGANGVGTIFSFTPGGVPNFLVWFNENLGKQQGSQNGNAGFYYNTTIAAGLIAGTSGFYGTAPDGGTNGDGFHLQGHRIQRRFHPHTACQHDRSGRLKCSIDCVGGRRRTGHTTSGGKSGPRRCQAMRARPPPPT